MCDTDLQIAFPYHIRYDIAISIISQIAVSVAVAAVAVPVYSQIHINRKYITNAWAN